ncbi:M3 family metallopeptidase [Citricoccus nitrophenolicus]|uniref:M3 family metallopeptidase n=1 Tax=Citricoccus nitrophenolicus TaxID=863575 RepID=A0ABV0ILS1_9MICC
MTENPLLTPSTLPYGLPDFAAISDEHFLPAFRSGMAQHREELRAIAADPAEATFENTFQAFERSGGPLRRVQMVFSNLVAADGTDTRQAIDEEISPELAAHEDAIYLDEDLYRRLAGLDLDAAGGAGERLDGEDRRLAEEVLKRFRLLGAELDAASKARLAFLNERLAVLSSQYGRRMVAENAASAVWFGTAAELAGLSEQDLSSAAAAAREAGHQGGYLLTLSMFTSQPWLAVVEDRESRRRIHEAAWRRGTTPGEHYALDLAVEQATLRAEKAGLLGYPSWAEYALVDRTAPGLGAVRELLERVIPAATANARRERATVQALAGHPIEPWDWPFYAARVEREQYRVDAAGLRSHFELDRVLRDGVFAAAGALYGLSFREREDLSGYAPGVRVWEVSDDGPSGPPVGLGLFVGDFFTRPTKSGGAWMNSFREASTFLGERPVVSNNLNIPQPAQGEPALLTVDQVNTLFHEFGHALHGLLSTARYATLSGTAVPRDFVEFPSQVNEMWMYWPQIVAGYARHVATGEAIDPELLEAIEASALWGEGHRTTEYLGAALLDLAWHALAPGTTVEDPLAFEAEHLVAAGLDPELVPPRYRSSYFKHIFAGGYAAGYYSYLWSEMLDADTVEWFRSHGGLTRQNGERFRAELLSRGNTRDPMESYRAFSGRDADPEHLLRRRGLL